MCVQESVVPHRNSLRERKGDGIEGDLAKKVIQATQKYWTLSVEDKHESPRKHETDFRVFAIHDSTKLRR